MAIPDPANDAGSHVGRYFQLTHDYLVPSLRGWLTRKQKETRRGRAELLLADLAAVWNARAENRQLPTLLQWMQIRWRTAKKDWTRPQRKMMRRAGQVHLLRGAAVATLLAVATFATIWIRGQIAEQQQATQATGMVRRLLDAETAQVPAIVAEIDEFRRWADPLLRAEIAQAPDTSRQKLHASLALLPVDPGQIPFLQGRLLDTEPHEVHVIRDALTAHGDALREGLWAAVLAPAKGKESQRLRAASALAKFDPNSAQWAAASALVVDDLVRENPVFLGHWSDSFRPVRKSLLAPLAAIFRDRNPERVADRMVATNLLADYAADNPRELGELLMDADDKQFVRLYPLVEQSRERCLPQLVAEVDKQPPVHKDKVVLEREGVIAENDARIYRTQGVPMLAKRFPVRMEAGKKYQLTMDSTELDSFLILQDKVGKELAADDDSGGALNARLVYRAERADVYTVFAAAFAKTGAFQLRIVELSTEGDSVLEKKDVIAGDEAPVKPSQAAKKPAKRYEVRLAAGKTYRLTMDSKDFDSYLILQDKEGKELAFDDDGGGALNSMLVFSPERDDIYTVFAAAFEKTGTFQLRVVELLSAEKLVFETKDVIDKNDGTVRRSPWNPVLAKRFPVPLEAGKIYRLSMHGKTLDSSLILQDKEATELGFNGEGDPNAMLEYRPARDDVYTVVAGSAKGTGAFQLSVVEVFTGDDGKETLAKRQANATVALLKMNQADKVWQLLKHSPDPRVRSYLIHRFGPLGADAGAIIKRFDDEPDITIRRALILSLGDFAEGAIPAADRQLMTTKLQALYRTDGDPGLHAASEWLLRTWKHEPWLKQVNEDWAKDKEQTAKRVDAIKALIAQDKEKTPPNWYVNGQGQTMVVIPGSVELMMGSPTAEAAHWTNEAQYKKRIGRTFAIAAKSVTMEQYRMFFKGYYTGEATYHRMPDLPAVSIDWYYAVSYCNWLSGKEGIAEKEWCYERDPQGPGLKLRKNYLHLSGYRLPTEAEMEYAIRAGAVTARYFGETEELLRKYAWYNKNSEEMPWPVGSLKPNDLGLFDALGNVCTWCQESYKVYAPGQKMTNDIEDWQVSTAPDDRVLRGGSFYNHASNLRSAFRFKLAPSIRLIYNGIRPSRTLIP